MCVLRLTRSAQPGRQRARAAVQSAGQPEVCDAPATPPDRRREAPGPVIASDGTRRTVTGLVSNRILGRSGRRRAALSCTATGLKTCFIPTYLKSVGGLVRRSGRLVWRKRPPPSPPHSIRPSLD